MLYTQISLYERKIIDYLYNKQKRSISFISRELKRNKSSISREIKRNQTIDGYNFETANKKYEARQYHKHSMHTLKYPEFTELFRKFYDKKDHGVEATWEKINSMNLPIKLPSYHHVFNWIMNSRWVIKRSDRLCQYYKKGGKRTNGIFSKFLNKFVLLIWTRPNYINNRFEYGHWEVDLVVGLKNRGYDNLITLTERVTWETYIKKLKTKNPFKCNLGIYDVIKENNLYVKTIACDNGIEFEKIGLLAKRLNINDYICDPYASYQRGSNEHVNGLIRRMYKKGTDFNLVSDQDIIDVQNKINICQETFLIDLVVMNIKIKF